PRQHVGERERALDVGEAGPVRQRPADRDALFAVSGELRPVRRDRRVEVELAPLHEKAVTTVSSRHGAPVSGSATPPHRSTTSSPSTYTATAAPTSPAVSKLAENASATCWKPAATLPS